MSKALSSNIDVEPRRRVRLGMLTPSSNTVVEPICARLLSGLPEITAHFQRFRVTDIRIGAVANQQFALEPMLAAAELLADARMNAICWNGTSASWLGLDRDRELCAGITKATGTPATTASLAAYEALARSGCKKIGVVTPYNPEILGSISSQLKAHGYNVVAELGLNLTENFQIAEVRAAQIAEMVRIAARAGSDAILIQCTNFVGAPLVETLERESGALILDSVAVALWGALRSAQISPALIQGWGRLFREI